MYEGEEINGVMARLVVKCSLGLVKTQRQAEYVLLCFVIVAICISAMLFFNTYSSSTKLVTRTRHGEQASAHVFNNGNE